jgi:hypothetical protein
MKNLVILLFLIFALNVSAQKIVKLEKVTDHSTYIKGNNFEGAIFTKDYNTDRSISFPGKRFTPNANEIILVEKLIIQHLDTVRNKWNQSVFVHERLRKYIRQYFGYINEKGERIIYINALLRNSDFIPKKDWSNDLVTVEDGGNSYWGIKINLSTHQLFEFRTNSVA